MNKHIKDDEDTSETATTPPDFATDTQEGCEFAKPIEAPRRGALAPTLRARLSATESDHPSRVSGDASAKRPHNYTLTIAEDFTELTKPALYGVFVTKDASDRDRRYFFCWESEEGALYLTDNCVCDCLGHESPEEAREHFRQSLLDDDLKLDGAKLGYGSCLICGSLTNRYAYISHGDQYWEARLCHEHRNRESAETLLVLQSGYQLFAPPAMPASYLRRWNPTPKLNYRYDKRSNLSGYRGNPFHHFR